MSDAIKEARELQRYHIGKIVETDGDTVTIQPQGEPIASPGGWWYPVDEADNFISTLQRENERLRELCDKSLDVLKDYAPGFEILIEQIRAALNQKEE